MCLARKHVDYLDFTNEEEYRSGKISYETYIRMSDIAMRCRQCERMDNGQQGDVLDECRVHFLRLFVSMKHDAESAIRARRAAQEAAEAPEEILAAAETGNG
ncbi:MAG: hypothetical protein ACK4N5_14015 [Myxococcales bacterium]